MIYGGDETYTFEDAFQQCYQKGMEVATINSREEQDAFDELRLELGCNHLWINMFQYESFKFEYTTIDGTYLPLPVPWDDPALLWGTAAKFGGSQQPDGVGEQCVVLYLDDHLHDVMCDWIFTSCNICTPDLNRPPTAAPTAVPTASPTETPTANPTAAPTASPTAAPTTTPTAVPTSTPTTTPTSSPTSSPTETPTASPTSSPTAMPTSAPTCAPTRVKEPVCKDIGKRKSCRDEDGCFWKVNGDGIPGKCRNCSIMTRKNRCEAKGKNGDCTWNECLNKCE